MNYYNFTDSRVLDPMRPGVITNMKEFDVKDMFGRDVKTIVPSDSLLLYTDYDNVQLRFSCTELDNYWHKTVDKYYYIAVRNRKFDSLKALLPLFAAIGDQFDLNKIFFPYQGPNCKN